MSIVQWYIGKVLSVENGYPGKLLYRKYGILIIPEENKAIMTLYNIAFKNQIGLSVPRD